MNTLSEIPNLDRQNKGKVEHPVVIITGASRGLGAAAAQFAVKLGARVVLAARSEAALTNLANSIKSKGGSALVVPADVSEPDDCQKIVAEAVGQFSRIDALINNAGILEPVKPILQWDVAGWHENIKINFLGAVMLAQAALPHLRENWGRIINVSSGAAMNPVPGWGAYSASKAALNQFTRVLAAEEKQITAIAFRPGVVDTEMQATIRRQGKQAMQSQDYDRYVSFYTEGQLLPPALPARALVVLSLCAPREWSGEFLSWDDQIVQTLVSQYSNNPFHF